MAMQRWQQTLGTQQAAGTLFNTFTTAKTILNPQALIILPGGDQFWQIGKKIAINVQGAISNIVTTPGTITFQVMVGAAIAFTTGAIQLSTTAHTTLPFWLNIELTVQALGNGTNAKLMGQAEIKSQTVAATAVADSSTSHTVLMAPNTAPAQGAGFDSTIANVLDFFGAFSISNAGNGVQIHQYEVIDKN